MTKNLKLNFLVRKNQGKNLLPSIIKDLSNLLAREIKEKDFLCLKESDLIREDFIKKVSQNKNFKIVTSTEFKDISKILEKINNDIQNFQCFLFFRDSDKFGALKINLNEIIENLFALLSLDGDTIFFCESGNRLHFNLTFYEESNSIYYELFYKETN